MKIIQKIGVSLVLLMLVTACDNPLTGEGGFGVSGDPAGNVIIRIAGSGDTGAGRTVLPKAPDFNKYELTLQKEGEDPITVEDTSGLITGAGVGVRLTAGTWTITLDAYQDVAELGNVLAAKGSVIIEVINGERAKTVSITLNPLAIGGDYKGSGVFTYTVILPEGVDTASLSLKDSDGNAVNGCDALSGSIVLPSGYYDLSVILTKNGQSAGVFESVHIYSGLESPVELDLSAVEFAGKVYIMGTLGGIRLGTVKIARDPAGADAIKTLALDATPAVRSANWIIDIPSAYAGTTVYAVQEFEGIKSAKEIAGLPVNGVADVALSVTPVAPYIFNVARWYDKLTASGGEDSLALAADGSASTYWQSERHEENGDVWLEVDLGFPVTVDAGRLVFYADGNGSVLVDGYCVQYWNGGEWITLIHREQYFEGTTDGSVSYGNFFPAVTARKFRWEASGVDNAPALIEFGLYKTYDRSALTAAIPGAQQNHDNTPQSPDGENIPVISKWVTPVAAQNYQEAIDAAQAVRDDLFSDADNIAAALVALNGATTVFNNAKQVGLYNDIAVTGFHVQDGYTNKFVVTWSREPSYQYRLSVSATGADGSWTLLEKFPTTGGTAAQASYTVTNIGAGQTRFFKMEASQTVADREIFGKEPAESGPQFTLGVPVLSLAGGPSYRTVYLSWTAAQKADTYRIVYEIAGDATSPHALEVAISALTPIAGGYAYSFQPNGYNNPQITGRKIDIYVEALNNALHQASGCDRAEITTTSNTVETRLVGPAELSATATQATTPNNIAVSWNPVEGAGGYYVFRRQFNLNNNGLESNDTVKYYVSAGDTLTVTGKGIAAGNADTPTVKAAAAFANNKFTLTDTYMNDTEYSGTYNGYAVYYKNQQNELAWGYPYRYFVVPVIAEADTVTFNGSNVSYSVTANGETVAYTSIPSFEKTGFTIGFAQNVTATKGTGGNQIQITWGLTPMAASANFTASSYRLYRRAYDGTEWSYEQVNGSTYADSEGAQIVRGVVYEYTVGINGFNAPHTFSRYMERYRAQVDGKGIPNAYGFMLEMVKLQGVSRDARPDGNGNFGEMLTFYKNAKSIYNQSIDGYKIDVMNRNVNASWNELGHIPPEGSPTDATQEVFCVNNTLLKVLRDYKHYFRVRSYVLNNDGEKVYSPEPDWNYETLFAANRNNQDNANFLQTDYVKWGARQITPTEFTKIATLAITWGIHNAAGNRSDWSGTSEKWVTTSNNGSSGRAGKDHNGSTQWWFYFDNYKPDLDTNANRNNWTYSTTFVTVNTGSSNSDRRIICANTTISWQYPHTYKNDGNYGSNPCDITGPSCVSPLYTGKIRFNGLTWGGGNIEVQYPSGAATVNISGGQANTPLPFQSQSEDRRTANNEWY